MKKHVAFKTQLILAIDVPVWGVPPKTGLLRF